MIHTLHFFAWLTGRIKSVGSEDRAAQLVEFAVSLPLLVLFVVGIFDFSNAFTLKQKLTNIARDAARIAAAEPSSDVRPSALPTALPMSVVDAFQDIDKYLLSNNLSECGIGSTSPTNVGLMWTYQNAASCPPGELTIIINRGYYFPANGTPPLTANCTPTDPGGATALVATCISIQYAYPWKFGRVASLLGANTKPPSTLTATAVTMNEN